MNIFLTLLQLKGIGSKTILSKLKLENREYDLSEIYTLINTIFKYEKYTLDDVGTAMQRAAKIENECVNRGIKIISYLDEEYPSNFEMMKDDRPVVFFYRGDITLLRKKTVTVIGTREPLSKSINYVNDCVRRLVQKDIVVVSGLAIGCDTIVHQSCIRDGGKTIAILPCAINDIYPKKNTKLLNAILDIGGGIISEYPMGYKMSKGSFIERDRIQAGISDGVILIESKINGGSMHAVKYAKKYSKFLACYKANEESKTNGNLFTQHKLQADVIENENDILKFVKKIQCYEKTCEKQITLNEYLNKEI